MRIREKKKKRRRIYLALQLIPFWGPISFAGAASTLQLEKCSTLMSFLDRPRGFLFLNKSQSINGGVFRLRKLTKDS